MLYIENMFDSDSDSDTDSDPDSDREKGGGRVDGVRDKTAIFY